MLNYTPSQLTENKTLLEEFLRIRDYLEANPLYKVYYAGTNYVAGVLSYAMSSITLKEGEKLGVGDVVLFANAYYAKVEDVSEDVTTFTVSEGVNIRGPQGATGATGPQGPIGPTGATGPAGKDGTDGQDGFGTFAVFVSQKLIPSNTIVVPLGAYKRPAIDDTVILLSSYTEQYVAYSQIAMSTIKSYDALNGQATVRIGNVIDTKGERGAQGEKGDTGAQGPQGEAGNAMYIYNGSLDSSVANVQVSQITIPTGRTLQAEDILISSYESSVGAMAQVVTIVDGVATVNFIGQISAGGGGTTLNKYTYTIQSNPSSDAIGRVYSIMHTIKGRVYARVNFSSYWQTAEICFAETGNSNNTLIIKETSAEYGTENYFPRIIYYNYMAKKDYFTKDIYTYNADGTVSHAHQKYTIGANGVEIIYYNDTEIT